MTELFLKLLDMSIQASWLVLAVAALRLVLKKAPKAVNCALWALVAFRLLCPFSFESALSLVPSADPIPQEILYSPAPQIDSGVPIINQAVNSTVMKSMAPQIGASVNPAQVYLAAAASIWAVGVAALLIYALISYLRLRRRVKASIHIGSDVRICDYIDSPFVLGIWKPLIYLPSALAPDHAAHVLAHERAHLKRRDHWWKPLGFALLAVYWFNPLIWMAYILFCRDIELACDERVVREMGVSEKKAYSEALLSCSVPRHRIAACPLAFGEVGVKERVKNVLNYKKPSFWISVVGIAAIVIAAVCFLTNPKSETPLADDIPQSMETALQTDEPLTDTEILQFCQKALTGFQAQNCYYLSTQSIFQGDNALNSYSTAKLWKNGNDWLRSVEIEEALEKWQYVEVSGKQYESGYNGYYDQDENTQQWVKSNEDLSQNFEEWLHSFDWDGANISLKSIGDQVGFRTVTCTIENGWTADGMRDPASEITFVLDGINVLRTVMYNVKYTDSTGSPLNDFLTTTILSYNEYVIAPEIEAAFQAAEKSDAS